MRASSRRVTTALLAATFLLAACAAGPDGPEPDETTTPPPSSERPEPGAMPEPPTGLDEHYEQDLDWEECGSEFECARVEVPMDYDVPQEETIEIAVKRLLADDPQGSLLINPGGPGGSGIDLVEAASIMFTSTLRSEFDIVGFDPRGVGQSSAVECVSDAEMDRMRSTEFASDDEGLAELRAEAAALAEQCEERTGELLGHVDTVSAARDMDVLRHVLGEPQLDYLGFSYGTLLGATYAELFPQQVGRFALDGAVDPALGDAELTLGQAGGFEAAIRAYAADCLEGSDCPLDGPVDAAVEQVQDLLELAEATPVPTASSRDLTVSLMASGIILTLYDDEYWPLLTAALTAAMDEHDGSQLLFLADLGADREPDGTYSGNSTEAFTAINCLDYSATSDAKALERDAERLVEASPTFGELLAYSEVGCQEWPVEAEVEREPIRAEGAGPILVIGTTGDPATPYKWSASLAEQLDDAALLTYDGEGHTAYGRSNACIADAVDAYLISGEMPGEDLVC